MKVSICFKVEPKLETMQNNDWISKDNKVDTSFLVDEISLFDESALELGLRIKDKTSTYLKAITVGETSSLIQNLYSLKYDEVIQIKNDSTLNNSPEVVANAIFSLFKKTNDSEDVIIMGQRSSVGYNAKTPFILAELLNYPCISEVIEVQVDENHNTLSVKSLSDSGIVVQKINPPCVFSVGNTQNCYLRIPTLMEKIKTKNKKVLDYKLEDLCNEGKIKSILNNYELVNLSKSDNSRKGIILNEGSMSSKVEVLYENYLKGKIND
jgi:electron transfer flavoprotein alpha/beta subunit